MMNDNQKRGEGWKRNEADNRSNNFVVGMDGI